jgi:hypothetical protein
MLIVLNTSAGTVAPAAPGSWSFDGLDPQSARTVSFDSSFATWDGSTPWGGSANMVASSVTSTSAVVSWSAAINPRVTSYLLKITPAGGTATTQAATGLSATLTGLTPDLGYVVQIAAVNAAGGQSAFQTANVAFTAAESSGGDTTAPFWTGASGLAVTTEGLTTATVAWTAAVDNVAVTGYRLRLTLVGGSPVVTNTGNTATAYTFGGLTQGASYLVEVAAYDAAGNVSAYQAGTATITTEAIADTTPPSWTGASGLRVASVGVTTAVASWTAAIDNVAVAGYKLRLTPNGGSPVVLDNGGPQAFFTLTNLLSTTNYLLEIAAYDAAGNISSYQAGTATFTTSSSVSAGSSGGSVMSQYVFGSGQLIGTQLSDASGNQLANSTPLQFGALQDISLDISFDTKMLYGSLQFPIAIGRGKGKVSGKAASAQINGSIWNGLIFGQTMTAGLLSDVLDTTGMAIPATPFTVTASNSASLTSVLIPNSGTWAGDLGLKNAAGLPLTKVPAGTTPTTGQYAVAAGVYIFAAADTGNLVFISFQYTATSTTARESTVLNLPMGYTPSFKADLFLPYNGKTLTLSLLNCVSTKLTIATKLDDFSIPSFDFEAFANSANQLMTYSMSDA